jgi:hypothetical protein
MILLVANILGLNNGTIVVRPEQTNSVARKNIIISDPRKEEKILTYKVVLEKSIDGRENIQITIKSPRLGEIGGSKNSRGQAKEKKECRHCC